MIKNAFVIILAVFCVFMLSVFPALAEQEEVMENLPESEIDESLKEKLDDENRGALEAFGRILNLTREKDRSEVLPEIEAAYKDIIKKYPKAYLTQEIYWRLMEIYLKDTYPPSFEKAENNREEFIMNYPESQVKSLIDRTLSESYYRHSEWTRIIRFYTPFVKDFIERTKDKKNIDKTDLKTPWEMFLYSEAKFNTGDMVEAEKGYKIVYTLFPETREGTRAFKKLEEIKENRQKPE